MAFADPSAIPAELPRGIAKLAAGGLLVAFFALFLLVLFVVVIVLLVRFAF